MCTVLFKRRAGVLFYTFHIFIRKKAMRGTAKKVNKNGSILKVGITQNSLKKIPKDIYQKLKARSLLYTINTNA